MTDFPIHPETRRKFPEVPRTVPWSLVEPHEARAQRNHSQTLRRLAERGGLTAGELWAVVNDKHWGDISFDDESGYVRWLLAKLAEASA